MSWDRNCVCRMILFLIINKVTQFYATIGNRLVCYITSAVQSLDPTLTAEPDVRIGKWVSTFMAKLGHLWSHPSMRVMPSSFHDQFVGIPWQPPWGWRGWRGKLIIDVSCGWNIGSWDIFLESWVAWGLQMICSIIAWRSAKQKLLHLLGCRLVGIILLAMVIMAWQLLTSRSGGFSIWFNAFRVSSKAIRSSQRPHHWGLHQGLEHVVTGRGSSRWGPIPWKHRVILKTCSQF